MDLFAKNLHAENVYTDHGYFGDLTASSTLTAGQRLCVNDDAGTPVCVTGTQLRSLLNGSVLGSHTESAANENADAPGGASGAPASSAEESADAASSTTAIDTEFSNTSG